MKKHPPMSLIKPNWKMGWVPGAYHPDAVATLMRKFIPEKIGECEIPFTAIAYDTDAKAEVRYSSRETPAASLPLAVQASMTLPWAMRHVTIGKRRLSDGGIVHNFAIDIPQARAIGLKVYGVRDGLPKRWKWWGSYSAGQFAGLLEGVENTHIDQGIWDKHTIVTMRSPISGADFGQVDAAMIEKLFNLGYERAGIRVWN